MLNIFFNFSKQKAQFNRFIFLSVFLNILTYVKAEDGKQTVGAYLKSVNSALVIKNVVRFEVGEGIEKKVDDFAAEVAAQMAGN